MESEILKIYLFSFPFLLHFLCGQELPVFSTQIFKKTT